MSTFTLTARGPFSLAASIRFLEGFTPAAYTGTVGGPLEMAFPVEGTWRTAGVRVREHPGGVECEVVSPRQRAGNWSPVCQASEPNCPTA